MPLKTAKGKLITTNDIRSNMKQGKPAKFAVASAVRKASKGKPRSRG